MHEIEKEPGGGLEPLQPSLASTRWRMGHPPIVRVIPKLVAPTGFEPILLESESSILPIILRSNLVVPLGFAPRPYTFKGCRTAIIPWNIFERKMTLLGIEPRASDDSNIRFRLFTSHPFASRSHMQPKITSLFFAELSIAVALRLRTQTNSVATPVMQSLKCSVATEQPG